MTRVVIGYDGSEEARSAVDFAAKRLTVDAALVVNVFSPPPPGVVAAPIAGPVEAPVSDEQMEALERGAHAVAEEGVDRARNAGLAATTEVRQGDGLRDVAEVLHEVADEHGADLIVVGHRDVSRLESAVLGSVSISAVRAHKRPVLVVTGDPGA